MDKWKPHGPNWAKTPHVSCWAVLTYMGGQVISVTMALCLQSLCMPLEENRTFFFFQLIKLHAHGKKNM